MAEFVVFWIMAPLALGAAISMLFMRNAVHAALLLVVNFFAIAVLYAVLEAQFLAVIQIIVYAGAIMVLFLFVLMLLGINREEAGGGALPRQAPVAIALGVALFAVLAAGVASPFLSAEDACPTETPAEGQPVAAPQSDGGCAGLAAVNEEGNVRAVGLQLFTRYVWPFEVVSALLIVAAVGAMVIGRKHEAPEDLVDQPANAMPEPRRDGPGPAPGESHGDRADTERITKP
ncbi:MAG TPA: NADH-quinone oxidoreductase subunit J [Egibacteraceae bacterium]|nr:NADH-quinone oxidoreductase subunit J [Egibacteraceae bacterium]